MEFSLAITLEAIIIASALSMDAFVASFAYGSNRIKIPMMSIQIINIVCSSILGLSLFIGRLLRPYLPEWLTVAICFTILFVLGLVKLFDSITKSIIRKHCGIRKKLEFSIFNFKFVLNLYANPEKADVDASKTISPLEAVSLAVALSLDGIAVGFGAALGNANGFMIVIFSLITDAFAIFLGCYVGNKIARKLKFNISWLSGVMLIVLAFFKLF